MRDEERGEASRCWELVARVSEVGAVETWEARCRESGSLSWLRFLEPGAPLEEVTRFWGEADALSALGRSPRRSALLEIGDAAFPELGGGERRFIAIERVKGKHLWSLLERGGPFPLKLVRYVAIHAARALRELHARGVVHGAPSTEAWWIRSADHGVWLAGFEHARVMTDGAVPRWSPSSFAGETAFLSPELLRSEASGEPVDGRSDIYVLGLVLFHVSVGFLPSRDPMEAPKPSELREMPEEDARWLDALVGRCLAHRPEERFQSCDEMLDWLRWCV